MVVPVHTPSQSAEWVRYVDNGRTYLDRGEFQKAIVELEKAIEMDSSGSNPTRSGMAYYLRGMCYARLDDLSAAARDFRSAWLIDQKLTYYEAMERAMDELVQRGLPYPEQ
jgi:Tfp pilus assembly protein PilF